MLTLGTVPPLSSTTIPSLSLFSRIGMDFADLSCGATGSINEVVEGVPPPTPCSVTDIFVRKKRPLIYSPSRRFFAMRRRYSDANWLVDGDGCRLPVTGGRRRHDFMFMCRYHSSRPLLSLIESSCTQSGDARLLIYTFITTVTTVLVHFWLVKRAQPW